MSKLKKPLLFVLSLLPVAILGGIFAGYYLLDTMDPAMKEEMARQVGDLGVMVIVGIVQTVLYGLVAGFLGYILTRKIGLLKPFTFQKKRLLWAVAAGAFTGALLCVDHFVSGTLYPQIQTVNLTSISIHSVLASILYGGIIEEVLLRLFFMSLLALIIWKLFFRKYTQDQIPQKVYIIANVVAALVFSAGHLPATVSMFGGLDLFLVARCFLLNGIGGYLFGEIFRKYGIGYAMIAHAGAHIVKFALFGIFL